MGGRGTIMGDYQYAALTTKNPLLKLLQHDNIEVETDGGMQYWRIYGIRYGDEINGRRYYRAKLRKYVNRPKLYVGHESLKVIFRELPDSQAASLWMRKGTV